MRRTPFSIFVLHLRHVARFERLYSQYVSMDITVRLCCFVSPQLGVRPVGN
jgi:hypothetical protein